jgi:alkylation response protein AidB-like acyl-CoA dehydrogenase
MGGLGFSCEYPQEKFFRDCKVGKKDLLRNFQIL